MVWLVWVLGQQAGIDGAAKLLLALTVLALALWLFGLAQTGPSSFFASFTGRAFCGAILGGALWLGFSSTEPLESQAEQASSGTAVWKTYSTSGVNALAAAGQPVFIDFTAAWCVSCQVNKKAVLQTDKIERAFAAKKVNLVRADWTRRDAEIAQALASYGRNGVPVYVLLRPGKAPLVLPELLTSGIVLDALSTL